MDEKRIQEITKALEIIQKRSPLSSTRAAQLLQTMKTMGEGEIEQTCSELIVAATKDPKAKIPIEELKILIEIENTLGARTQILKFRVSPTEKKQIEAAARKELGDNGDNKDEKPNVSEYLRKKILGKE
jgi:hypothetical protein